MRTRTNRGFTALFAVLGFLLAPLSANGADEPESPGNIIDEPKMHPAIPLLDEAGNHVLESGKPYSPRTSCGTSGCHDYEAITHSFHIQQGLDEARDDWGAKRGQPQLSSPGYFGGYNCMGGSTPQNLALLKNTGAEDFADYGAPGIAMRCVNCHAGGGWMEKDRNGRRYDEVDPGTISPFDGDYYNRGTDENNASASMDTVARWDWKKSGVIENDCMMCHADYTALKTFDELLDTGSDAYTTRRSNYRSLRGTQLVREGHFRYAATALLEFVNLKHDEGVQDDMALVSFEREIVAGGGHGGGDSIKLKLDEQGQPKFQWNAAAFDENGKIGIPMLGFPGNDNCMQCHSTSNSRRGFYGFGEGAEAVYTDEETGVLEEDYQDDVHKGKTWTADNGEERSIENCNSCHSREYFRKPFENVDLDQDHNFLKGNSDMDVRNDLDYAPNARSCEDCHMEGENPVVPSGHDDLLTGHIERWKHAGDMTGYPADTLERITKTHFDIVSCQACHITGKKGRRGRPIQIMYRYREAANGERTIVPYNPRLRYQWRDRNNNRVLSRHELNSVYELREDADGENYGMIVDPVTGKDLGRVSGRMSHGSYRFNAPDSYEGYVGLKQAYDQLMVKNGLSDPDVAMFWISSNDYIISHNTRPAVASVQCEDCHHRKQDDSFSSLVSTDGLFGEENIKEVSELPDKRLVDEGIVVLGMPYMKVDDSGKITMNVADILTESKIDPSMTILKSASATIATGSPVRLAVDAAISKAGYSDPAQVAGRFGGSELFLYRPNYGDAMLRQVALLSDTTPQVELVFPNYQMQVAIAARAVTDSAAGAGFGGLASPAFGLEASDKGGRPVSSFAATPLILKLPYDGSSTDPDKVRVITSSDGSGWSAIDKAKIVHVQPRSIDGNGYVAFQTDHFSYFAVADKDVQVLGDSSAASDSGGGADYGLPLLASLLLGGALLRRKVTAWRK